MRPRALVTLVALALVMLVGTPAHAQTAYDFKMPFEFIANGKVFPAGNYMLIQNTEDSVFVLESTNVKGPSVILPIETRLSEDKAVKDPVVVFDKYEGKLIVSELSVPGDDGYLFNVTKAKHTHQLLTGTKRKG